MDVLPFKLSFHMIKVYKFIDNFIGVYTYLVINYFCVFFNYLGSISVSKILYKLRLLYTSLRFIFMCDKSVCIKVLDKYTIRCFGQSYLKVVIHNISGTGN